MAAASMHGAYTSGFFLTAVLVASIAFLVLLVMETGEKREVTAEAYLGEEATTASGKSRI